MKIIRFRQRAHRTRCDTVFDRVRRLFDFRRGNGTRFRHLRRLAVRALSQRETVDRHRKRHRKYTLRYVVIKHYGPRFVRVARIEKHQRFRARFHFAKSETAIARIWSWKQSRSVIIQH